MYFNLCGFSIKCPLKFLFILKKEKYSPYGELILYFYSKLGFLYAETYSTIKKLILTIQRNQHTKDVGPFVAYCVTELEIVSRGLTFWQILFLPAIVPNMNTRQI